MSDLMSNLKLYYVSEKYRKDLAYMVKDPKTMKWIANGKPWTDEKIDKFIKFAQDEKENNNKWYTRGIILNGRLIGIVQIHPVQYREGKNKKFLTIFINHRYRGQGIGPIVIKRAVRNYERLFTVDDNKIYMDVRINNTSMLKLIDKMNFTKIGDDFDIGRNIYRRFVIA